MLFFNKITKTLFSSWTYSGHLAWFYFIYQFKHRTLDLLLTTMISIRVHSIATPIMTGCWKCEFDCLAFVKIYRKKKYENYKYNTLLNTPKNQKSQYNPSQWIPSPESRVSRWRRLGKRKNRWWPRRWSEELPKTIVRRVVNKEKLSQLLSTDSEISVLRDSLQAFSLLHSVLTYILNLQHLTPQA